MRKKQKSRRATWVKPWLARREVRGYYENLVRELKLEDSGLYRRWIRLDVDAFEELLNDDNQTRYLNA